VFKGLTEGGEEK